MTDSSGQEPVVTELFDNYRETQQEILVIETRKTRNKLFSIGIVIFLFDFIAISVINLVTAKAMITISIVPLIMFGLAFLSNREPLLSMILAALIIGGLWIYSITLLGPRALVMGWLSKVALIYLVIAGFQNATTAQRVKKELQVM